MEKMNFGNHYIVTLHVRFNVKMIKRQELVFDHVLDKSSVIIVTVDIFTNLG
jgi:hypothetical protein